MKVINLDFLMNDAQNTHTRARALANTHTHTHTHICLYSSTGIIHVIFLAISSHGIDNDRESI